MSTAFAPCFDSFLPSPDPPSALPSSPYSVLSKTMHGQIASKRQIWACTRNNRTLTDINRIRTGGVTHEFRTNHKLTYEDRRTNGDLDPFYPVENFEHASQRTERMSADLAEHGADSPDKKRTLNG
ncbi:hypothetical protein DPMN_038303 [Dreissena polymorpha]|uniref:Uncharacterized protein n=1 Tax=Dreissena polymorpha TaxID=45954 RepID=A0A9D4MF71_DREPO|nr:hypothetical protein DPMN_038303 [Dreissena polymorpha]